MQMVVVEFPVCTETKLYKLQIHGRQMELFTIHHWMNYHEHIQSLNISELPDKDVILAPYPAKSLNEERQDCRPCAE